MKETDELLNKIKASKAISKKTPRDVANKAITVGIPTGLIELDYRIGGFREGWYIVLTGSTGHGKTTLTRELVVSAAARKHKVFYFVGEESLETETRNMARIGAAPDEVEVIPGLAGRKYYRPTEARYKKFQNALGDWITFISYYDIVNIIEEMQGMNVETIVDMNIAEALRDGVRFFVLDNLSKLIEQDGNKVFDAQRRIIRKIQRLCRKYNATVLLVTHPNKRGDAVGGISEIINHADCVLQIKRLLEEDNRSRYFSQFPSTVAEKASGVLSIVKAREEGMLGKIPLMWDPERGALLNVTTMEGAMQYELDGWWTHSVAPF